MPRTTGNTEPLFIGIPWTVSVPVATAGGTARDGTGTLPVKVLTAGSNGSLIENLRYIPLVAQAAGNVGRLYIQDENSTSYRLVAETTLAETSGLASTAAAPAVTAGLLPLLAPAGYSGLRLGPGQSLYVGFASAVTGVGFEVVIQGGDY